MSTSEKNYLVASCACGSVEIHATGDPIVSVACYCDDCQEGSRQIEALPGAASIRGADGGTEYLAYRKDRIKCPKGAAFLQSRKIRQTSVTNRVVANCCNSAMYLNFDDGKCWVDIYRSRVKGNAPPVRMRICTKFLPAGRDIPKDVPSYAGYPVKFLAKLLAAWMAMLLQR